MKKEDVAAVNHFMHDEENYFLIFGIDKSFYIDKHQLYQNYLELQKAFHPDKWINKSNTEKIHAHQFSAKLNEMYNILNDDKKRAEYLLSLENIIVNSDNSNITPSQETLMEILELSENKDDKKIESIKSEAWKLFIENYPSNLTEAAQAIIKLQYLSKL